MSARHDFYQTDKAVIISVYRKKADPAEVSAQFTPRTLKVAVADEVLLHLDPLFEQVEPSESTYKTLSTKIEITLAKASAANWTALTSSSAPAAPAAASLPAPSAAAEASAAASSAPDSAIQANKQAKKDWSKIAASEDSEDQGANNPDDFFKKLFKDADDDTRRAMMKSYSESGGTTLSTNWKDVGSRTVTGEPPEGMERRKW